MLGFYLNLGLGVALALTAARWKDVSSSPTANAVLGIALTVVAWPYALYNNFNSANRS